MEIISEDKLRYLAGKHGYNLTYLEKDYFLTILLYMIKDVQGIYFKGGTCLNKIFLDHTRLSEDLDFASTEPIENVRKSIDASIDKKIFPKIETDKTTQDFVRYHIYYKSHFQSNSYLLLDINGKATIHLKTELRKVPNFYGLDFSINCLNIDEIVAEKIRALITRNQPRDYYDVYFILGKYKPNMDLVKGKIKEAREVFDMERVFRNANKIYSNWDADLVPLTNKKVDFLTVIKFLEKKLGRD